jgi:hypothetical protein
MHASTRDHELGSQVAACMPGDSHGAPVVPIQTPALPQPSRGSVADAFDSKAGIILFASFVNPVYLLSSQCHWFVYSPIHGFAR